MLGSDVVRRSSLACGALAALIGCGGPRSAPCEERDELATELPRVPLTVAEQEISAEVADSEDERSEAWAGRRCDLEGLLWVPDEVGPAAVTLCGVEIAVDLAFLRQGVVVAFEGPVSPCDSVCDECPSYDGRGASADPTESGEAVDAVLWLPAGQLDVVVGDTVDGLDAVALPTSM